MILNKIQKSKKNLILINFLLTIIGFFFLINKNQKSENKNRYWSNTISGPQSIDVAINTFFKHKKQLHPLEGIWQQSQTKVVAITSILEAHNNPVLFSKYIIIDEQYKNKVGTIEGSFHRTKFSDKYVVFERIDVPTKDYKKKNSTGTGFLILKNNNAIVNINSSKEFKRLDLNYNLIKIYPK